MRAWERGWTATLATVTHKDKDDEAKNEKETKGGKNHQGEGAGLDRTMQGVGAGLYWKMQGVGAGLDKEVQNGKETMTHRSKNSQLGRTVFKNIWRKYSVLKNIRLNYLVSKNTRLDYPV